MMQQLVRNMARYRCASEPVHSSHFCALRSLADIRDSLRFVLEDEGLDVHTAANGLEALERLAGDAGGGARPCVIWLT